MRINGLLIITLALGLAACQTTPIAKPPIVTVEPGPVDTTPKPDPKPDPKPVIADDAPGSSGVTTASLTMLTSSPNEKQGEQLPLINSNAEWVAFQDGTGPWKVLEGTNGVYPFEVTNKAGKYGLAYTCPKPAGSTSSQLPNLEIRLFTLADLAMPRFGCNVAYTGRPPGWTPPSTTTFKLSGKVAGLETSETTMTQAFVGPVGTGISVGADGTFSQSFPQGKYNLMVGKTDKPAAGSTNPPSIKFKKIIFERDLNLNADTTRNFDFAIQGFSPVAKTVSFTGIQAGEQGYVNPVMIVGGSYVYLNSMMSGGISAEFPSGSIDVFPENQLQTGDSYGMQLFVNGKQGRDYISKGIFSTGPTFISSFALPPVLTLQVTSEAPTPYVRPKVTLDQPLSNTGLVAIRLNEDVYDANTRIINQRSWSVMASGSWLGAKPSFTAPDFSGLTGWNTSLEFKNLNDLGWVVVRSDGDATLRFQRASLFNDDVARREYTGAEFAQDIQKFAMNLSSINRPTADKIKPIVTNTIPSDIGFTGTWNIALANTKNLEIKFSEEMDIASVNAAYESTTLPKNSVTLSWKSALTGSVLQTPNSVLVVTPNAALTVGSTYSFTLGTGAKDISGNPLADAKVFSFKVTP
jgi:Bacterial Ig-like domain